ncbi:MAG: sterol desaturase family protein [Parashewanella sp.]
MNQSAMEAFRTKYRQTISKYYSGWLHMFSVLIVGLIVMLYAAGQLNNVEAIEWLALPITLLVVNFCEYAAHRWLGHKKTKLAKLFYSRHTGDHHSFFLENYLPWLSTKDWRVVLFPTYLIFAFVLGLILPLGTLLHWYVSPNTAYLVAIAAIFGYLLYEVMHFSYHLPDGSFVERIPVWRELRQLHNLHHRRNLMTKENFNITLPIFDWILNTLYWEKPQK